MGVCFECRLLTLTVWWPNTRQPGRGDGRTEKVMEGKAQEKHQDSWGLARLSPGLWVTLNRTPHCQAYVCLSLQEGVF